MIGAISFVPVGEVDRVWRTLKLLLSAKMAVFTSLNECHTADVSTELNLKTGIQELREGGVGAVKGHGVEAMVTALSNVELWEETQGNTVLSADSTCRD